VTEAEAEAAAETEACDQSKQQSAHILSENKDGLKVERGDSDYDSNSDRDRDWNWDSD